MNVSEQIIKVLNELSNKMGIGIDWTHQNILPQIQDLMNRYTQYQLYSSIMWLILGLCCISISIMFFIKIKKEKNKECSNEDLIYILWSWAFGFVVVGIVITVCQIDNIIQLKTVPETYFINYIQRLLTKLTKNLVK